MISSSDPKDKQKEKKKKIEFSKIKFDASQKLKWNPVTGEG